jgi:Flp pilus assembly CpaF family ATPase
VTYLETRKGTLDSKLSGLDAEISATWLVERALRLAPDRILVGECRGVEVLAWLEAVNTGHAGSLTTLHADQGALAAIRRLEGLVLRAASLMPQREVRRQIASAIQLLFYTAQYRGNRYVRDIIQLVPSEDAGAGFASSPLFEARPELGQPLCRTSYPLDPDLARYFAAEGMQPAEWLAEARN